MTRSNTKGCLEFFLNLASYLILMAGGGGFGFFIGWMLGLAIYDKKYDSMMAFTYGIIGLFAGSIVGAIYARKMVIRVREIKKRKAEADGLPNKGPDTADEFITFQKFNHVEDAMTLLNTLKDQGIVASIEDLSPTFDLTFTSNSTQNEVAVKVRQSHFEKAKSLLETLAEHNIQTVPNDHYLYDFTDVELLEVVEKSDEWNEADYLLAKQILRERGIQIDQQIESLKRKRLAKLTELERGNPWWLIFGFVSAFLGGLLAIFMGWSYWQLQKIGPSGQKYFGYDAPTRNAGKWMFWMGIVCLIGWVGLVVFWWW